MFSPRFGQRITTQSEQSLSSIYRLSAKGMPGLTVSAGERQGPFLVAKWRTEIAVFALVAFSWQSISAESPALKPAAVQTSSIEQPPSGANAITQAAVRSGVLNCVSRINQVTNFVGAGSNTSGAVLFLPPAQPDQRLVALSMEVKSGALTSYVSANFAPNQANGCGAVYDAVTWWPDSCDAVANRSFGTLRKIGALQREIIVLDGGQATKVFLMPAGKGCVSIKKEVVL